MAVLGWCELTILAMSLYFLDRLAGADQRAAVTALALPCAVNALALPWDGLCVAIVLALAIGGVAAAMGLYRPQICQDPLQVLVTAIIAGIVVVPIVFLFGIASLPVASRAFTAWCIAVFSVWIVVVAASRTLFGIVLRNGHLARRVLVVAGNERARRIRDLLLRHHGPLLEPVLADPAATIAPPGDVWGVVVGAGTETADISATLRCALRRGVPVFTDAGFQEQHLGRIDPVPISWVEAGIRRSIASEMAKRATDLLTATLVLLLMVPLMALVAVLIRIDSAGPIFYRQQRIGLGGRPFMLFKFRSMRTDAEASGTPRWAQPADPRITRVGHLIRQTRIDELPQLLNVMRGDMSMVGPRPERPHFVEQLAVALPFYRVRARVKPGLTGWAQVNYPYGASVEDAREKLAYDLYYVKNRSILLDIAIMFSTIRVVLFREGAR